MQNRSTTGSEYRIGRVATLCSCAGLALFLLTGCAARRITADDLRPVVRAGMALGLDVDYHDNRRLYVEAASWLGSPYRTGGNTRQGVDCSGLTRNLYQSVYGRTIARQSAAQMRQSRRVRRRKLKEGDLVFFTSPAARGACTHVGLYLKDKRFIHAGTSRGVVVSSLTQSYWADNWLRGGRIE